MRVFNLDQLLTNTINFEYFYKNKYIPDYLEIKYSNIENAGLGVFTKTDIEKGTYIGNYLGNIIDKSLYNEDDNDNDGYSFTFDENNYITAKDINTSNFTRYINCSYSDESENVFSWKIDIEKSPYFNHNLLFARRDIQKNEELLYYYSHQYSKKLNITYHLNYNYIYEYKS